MKPDILISGGALVRVKEKIIIPNTTHNQQPYAVIENMIIDEKFRKRGPATQCLNFEKEIARKKTARK